MFFKQRLTLACEATFWIIVAAAVTAPQLASPVVSLMANRLQHQAPPTWLHPLHQGSKLLSASDPQLNADGPSAVLTHSPISTRFLAP